MDLVRLLVGHGADTMVKDKHGFTMLHRASRMGSICIARSLLEHAADSVVKAKNDDGSTRIPLHGAA